MKTKFEGLIKEIVEEMIDDRINEIEDRPSREEDVMGDEIINDQAFDDFMQFIEGLPKDMQIQLIKQYQAQLLQQLEDSASEDY
jgi:hypothetical protein